MALLGAVLVEGEVGRRHVEAGLLGRELEDAGATAAERFVQGLVVG